MDAPWLVNAAVATLGGERPCILGNKLECHYFVGENYLEVDCDVASSFVAKKIARTVLESSDSVVVDHGLMLEGHSRDELPERLLASVRYSRMDMDACCVDLSAGKPRPYDSQEYRYVDSDGEEHGLDD